MELIFIIDVSGSMAGSRIAEAGRLVESLLHTGRSITDACFVSFLLFNRSAQWVQPMRQPVDEVEWCRPECFGLTSTGLAMRKLGEYLNSARAGSRVIVLITDGRATDDVDDALAELIKSDKFRQASRFAVAVGPDCDRPMLEVFAGGAPDRVIDIIDAAASDVMKKEIITLRNII